jgi:hypothetical protein
MIKELKQKIKELSQEQKELKNQRKTVHLVGDRKVDPYIASCKVIANKVILTEMFVIYLHIRGKDIKKVYKYYEMYTPEYLEILKQKYIK